MKVGIDVRMFDSSGIGTTIKGLLDHAPADFLKEAVLFSKPGWKNPYDAKTVEAPFSIYGLKQHFFYPGVIKKAGVELFHMPHYDVPYFYDGPFVATVHDLIHYLHPEYSTKPFSREYSGLLLRHVAARAKRVIAVSESTKADMERFFPTVQGRVRVIHPAVSEKFRPVEGVALETGLRELGISGDYVLYVGNLRASKNTPALLEAYRLYRSTVKKPLPLVLAGANTYKKLNLAIDGVRYLGKVAEESLAPLYSGASVFLFPSLYEGFGLPPLEAMACGAPVLTSRVSSLPEVCADAAVYADPSSPQDIALKIRELAESPEKRARMRDLGFENVKRFGWRRFAERTIDVYREALSS